MKPKRSIVSALSIINNIIEVIIEKAIIIQNDIILVFFYQKVYFCFWWPHNICMIIIEIIDVIIWIWHITPRGVVTLFVTGLVLVSSKAYFKNWRYFEKIFKSSEKKMNIIILVINDLLFL